jgi:rubrerythrin
MRRHIESIEEFYAHALAIEREASERYHEFEAYFKDRGEEVLAGLCANLERMEREHFIHLARASEGMRLPVISAGCYCWIDEGPPESPAREFFYRIVTPRQLLEVALDGEIAAQRFFSWVAATTQDATVKALASAMADEEDQHIRWVQQAMHYREPMRQ